MHNTVVTEYESVVNVGDTIRESGIEVSISDKVKGYTSLSGIVLGDKVFGIQSSGLIGFSGDGDIVKISKEKTDTSVAILNKFENYKSVDYIELCDIPKGNEYVNCFKVICPHACSRAQLQTFDKSSILKPGYIHTENWTQFGPFQNVYEPYNLCMYMRTRFFKFLCYLYCSSAMTKVSKVLMSHVPLQDFTSNSDIDWSKSIEDIDKQLYRKYNLTQEEIDYIEKTIKPMK